MGGDIPDEGSIHGSGGLWMGGIRWGQEVLERAFGMKGLYR